MHTNECNKVICICHLVLGYTLLINTISVCFKSVTWYIDYDLVKSIPFVNPVGNCYQHHEKYDDFLCYQGHHF